jgi:hypothetical protein
MPLPLPGLSPGLVPACWACRACRLVVLTTRTGRSGMLMVCVPGSPAGRAGVSSDVFYENLAPCSQKAVHISAVRSSTGRVGRFCGGLSAKRCGRFLSDKDSKVSGAFVDHKLEALSTKPALVHKPIGRCGSKTQIREPRFCFLRVFPSLKSAQMNLHFGSDSSNWTRMHQMHYSCNSIRKLSFGHPPPLTGGVPMTRVSPNPESYESEGHSPSKSRRDFRDAKKSCMGSQMGAESTNRLSSTNDFVARPPSL